MNTRRNFLTGAGAWLAGSALGNESRAIKTISLFHTTDLHGHILPTQTYDDIGNLGGFARCATQIRKWRKDCPDHLLFDIGDVYQGTIEGYQTKGKVMIDSFNKLGYDGWVLGNHEFDWGLDVVESAVQNSQMPILTGNVTLDGKRLRKGNSSSLANLAPWMVKEVGGFRVGFVGLITPGVPFWSRPELLKGFGVLDPIESAKESIRELKAEAVDAIVVLGHMGWRRSDDFANPVQELLKTVSDIDLYIGGHTHQDRPSWYWSNVLCTQANYHGINCGRVDLSFDLESRKLVKRNAWTVLMDDRFALDPLIMESTKDIVADAKKSRETVIGTVKKPISARGKGNPFWQMICRSFLATAEKQKMPADLVFHGTFDTPDVEAGVKTIADAWQWIPYENWLVHATLTGAQLAVILEESKSVRYSDRAIFGLGDEELVPDQKYRVLFNSYDSQSGGRRLMKLREILEESASATKLIPVNTREALIDYFADGKVNE